MLTVFNIAGDRPLPSCCPLFFVAEPRRCFYPNPQENPLPARYLTKESSPFKFEYGNSSGQWDQKGNLRKVPGKRFLALKMKQTRRNGWCLHIRALMWGSVRSTCFCGCRGIPGRQSPYSEESREENENNPDPSWRPESPPPSLLRPLNISSFPVLWLGIVTAFCWWSLVTGTRLAPWGWKSAAGRLSPSQPYKSPITILDFEYSWGHH